PPLGFLGWTLRRRHQERTRPCDERAIPCEERSRSREERSSGAANGRLAVPATRLERESGLVSDVRAGAQRFRPTRRLFSNAPFAGYTPAVIGLTITLASIGVAVAGGVALLYGGRGPRGAPPPPAGPQSPPHAP